MTHDHRHNEHDQLDRAQRRDQIDRDDDLVGVDTDQLRGALHNRANMFEPAAGGLRRLEQRLAEEASVHPTSLATRRRSLPPQILSVAAALLLLAGGAAFLLTRPDASEIDASGGTTIAAAPEPDATEAADPDESDAADEVDATEAAAATAEAGHTESAAVEPTPPELAEPELDPAPPDFTFGPLEPTRLEAAQSFLDLIRLMDLDVEINDETGSEHLATVIGRNPAGAPIELATLELASRSFADGRPGFVVVDATSADVTISEPAFTSRFVDPDDSDDLTVAGSGFGFEATLGISIFASRDGAHLHRRPTTAGNFGEAAPFTEAFDVKGEEYAWVVVTSSVGDGDARFAARAVQFEAPLPDITYTVSNIPVDDPDGGLVARALPLGLGPESNEIRAVLPPGIGGLTQRGELPVEVDGQIWWNVRLPNAETGWVNSTYLTREGGVSDDSLITIADDFVDALGSEDPDAFAGLPWATDKPVRVGWSGGLIDLTAAEAASGDFWRTEREWVIPADFQPNPTLDTALQFLSPEPQGAPVDLSVSRPVVAVADDLLVSPYGLDNEVFASEFAGASVALLTSEVLTAEALSSNSSDGAPASAFEFTAVFVERSASGSPQIVGVVPVFWIP